MNASEMDNLSEDQKLRLAFGAMVGTNLLVVEEWSIIFTEYADGEITAEEVAERFATFLAPIAISSLEIIATDSEYAKVAMEAAKVNYDAKRSDPEGQLLALLDSLS